MVAVLSIGSDGKPDGWLIAADKAALLRKAKARNLRGQINDIIAAIEGWDGKAMTRSGNLFLIYDIDEIL